MRATVIGVMAAAFLLGGSLAASAGQDPEGSASGASYSQGSARFPGQAPGTTAASGESRQLPGRSGPGPTWGGASRPSGQAVMIRIEVTLTDQVGSGAPSKKAVTLTARDDNRAIIRTEYRSKAGDHGTPGPSLNVEARPTLAADGKIHLELSVLYDLPDSTGDGAPAKAEELPWTTRVQEGFGLLLDNDKPMVVSQSADPRINRKVTVEVRATVVK